MAGVQIHKKSAERTRKRKGKQQTNWEEHTKRVLQHLSTPGGN
jgi:hypothetical protein